MKLERIFVWGFSLTLLIAGSSCKGLFSRDEVSKTTGWVYGDSESGTVEYKRIKNMEAGPGLIFIPGGTFILGRTQEDVMHECNNTPRRVTISSFYMDETEIRNIDWLEYLNWLSKYYSDPNIVRSALPDTLVWRESLAYNEPMVKNYLRFPPFFEYPVVGVTWEQANDYCKWRTNRVNEKILIEQGFLPQSTPDNKDANTFDTEAYLADKYQGQTLGDAKLRFEDGVLYPDYRLPTEAEWEYAAYALICDKEEENYSEARIYPWDGVDVRMFYGKEQGKMMANFARGRGDYMGIAGEPNDGFSYTAPVRSFPANDFGLYDMAGNVNEWVGDVYRALSFEDVAEFNPYRGNVFKVLSTDNDGNYLPVDSLGHLKYTLESDSALRYRHNYRHADNRNYNDGDTRSSIPGDTASMYLPTKEITSLINDNARVYKGGSWKDRAYWLSPSTRRFLDQKKATNDLGFRCAMSHIGS